MITITDVLTNKQWVLPNSAGASPIYIGQYPPGRYDITNGSGAAVTVIGTSAGVIAAIPNGSTWNVSSQENDRSFSANCLDYSVWMHSGRFN